MFPGVSGGVYTPEEVQDFVPAPQQQAEKEVTGEVLPPDVVQEPEAYDYDAALDAMADAVSEAQLKAIFAPAWSRAKKDENKEMMDSLKANYDTFKAKFAESVTGKDARAII